MMTVKPLKNNLTKYFLFILLSVLMSLGSVSMVYANEAQMHETLVRIVQQLQSIKPLLIQAENQQPTNPRIKVHFDRFKDSDGHWHNGLRQDIDAIQKALAGIVNEESIEPRVYKPIGDDFIGNQR